MGHDGFGDVSSLLEITKKGKKIHNKESQEGRKQPKKKLREGYKEGREAQRKDTRTDGRREGQNRIIEIEKNTRNEEHHFLDDRVKKKSRCN